MQGQSRGKKAKLSNSEMVAVAALLTLVISVLLRVCVYPILKEQAAMTFRPGPVYVFAGICYPLMLCSGGACLCYVVRNIFKIELTQKTRKLCAFVSAVLIIFSYISICFMWFFPTYLVEIFLFFASGILIQMAQRSTKLSDDGEK